MQTPPLPSSSSQSIAARRAAALITCALLLCLTGPRALAQDGPAATNSTYDNFMPATVVVGQSNFTTGSVNQGGAANANTLNSPGQSLVVNGKLLIADSLNNRVLIFNHVPTASNATADVVIGQPDFTSVSENQGGAAPTARTLVRPAGLASDGTKLFVLDRNNHRALIFNAIPTANNAAADVVIGQNTMEDSSFGVSATKMLGPTGIAYDAASGKLIIFDSDNNRVLIYNSVPTGNGAPANIVVGQPDFTHNSANQGGPVGANTLALSTASGLGTYGGKLLVADRLNHRVLVFNQIPSIDNAPADVVIGQVDFTHNRANQGGDVSARGLDGPRGAQVDTDGSLYIPESGNARVLVYSQIPTANNAAADIVIGQPDFTTVTPGTTSRTLQTGPYHASFFPDHLVVSDATNNRFLIFTSTTACVFSLSPASASIPGAGTNRSVTLTASAPTCAWTAVSNDSFIAVTSAGAGTGSATVTWAVPANGTNAARTGTITIAGLTFTITQARSTAPNDFNHDGLSDLGLFQPGPGRFVIAGQPDTSWGAAGDVPVAGDFNGDGNQDIAVFRPANGTWYIKDVATIVWGAAGDIPVPGDYDGNGTTDIAVFRPSAGIFYIRNGATVAWGAAGNLPVVGDYNGDGVTDIAVYRPATGTWYVRDIMTVVYGFAADIPVPADYNGDGLTDIALFRPATGTWIVKDQFTQSWGASGDVPVPLDRNGDGRAELGVFRRGTATWYFKNHVTDGSETLAFGGIGDLPLGQSLPAVQTPWGDYDGDRKADLTVFRPSTAQWLSLRSLSTNADYTVRDFGISTDTPVGRDFDGDGKIDPAVYRPSLGRWFVLLSSTSYSAYTTQDWGLETDTPVPADYDGDGKADITVFRPSLGRWLILLSSSNNTSYLQYDWGLDGDIPVPADYDGDGRADIAVFRPSTGRWYILNRLTGAFTVRDWGATGDVPAAADFDGDGKADVAVFRPSLGRWFITSSIDGSNQAVDWGLDGDVAVPADYDADGHAEIAVFRPSDGTWYVRGLFNRSWGVTGDIPALRNP